MHNGNAYYKVIGYTAAPAYLRQAENGNIFAWEEDLDRESIVTSFERVPGGWADTGIGGCLQGSQVQEGAVHHKPSDLPEITAVQLNYRTYECADTGIIEEQYAENIGLLRRVVSTIAGPRTYDLVYAKTATLTYDVHRSNAFRVSLSDNYLVCGTPGAGEVTVGMLLSRRRAPWMELQFPSAQRYEIRVRNEAGDVVYQWSDGVYAAQATSTVLVDKDLEYSQTIPLQKTGGQELEGGYYTVEASLTTTNREFSGATRFFYSACEPSGAAIARRRVPAPAAR